MGGGATLTPRAAHLGPRALDTRHARRAAGTAALRGAVREGAGLSPARVPERPVGMPGGYAAHRRPFLSRRPSAVADRGGDRGRRGGRDGRDALSAARGWARLQ